MNLPSPCMNHFRFHKTLIMEIQRLSARFWWGGNSNRRKMHWAAWHQLCKPKADGGLGFCDPEVSNKVLLAKQGWRIIKNPDLIAARILKGCYFKEIAVSWNLRKGLRLLMCGVA
ncbi:hypothetical protein Dsin_000335 [Dipteronia sinensis]|uniref:Uncharacterized protein n=1 Tax=Dipteronia sinensis TaxID=43782 RepID=A0AAE0B3G3_9ROSI|nr:hypothetical protein Dsin_000335 [Dipteronia sinensis]